MTKELALAINAFCYHIPESKIGIYSPNVLDDNRLESIYDVACKSGEDIRPQYFIDSLKAHHPNIADNDIMECADTAFRHMLDIC
jgi:hypothetical protein